MDFLNKIGKTASKTYQVTKEKATSISEEIKLKSKINSLKDKKNDIYYEIGKIVFNDIKDNRDVAREEVTSKCNEISKIDDEISKLQMEILSYRKIKVCSGCGKEIDMQNKYCPECGKPQPSTEKVEIKEEPKDTVESEAIEVTNYTVNNESDKTKEDNSEENNTENDTEENDEDNM